MWNIQVQIWIDDSLKEPQASVMTECLVSQNSTPSVRKLEVPMDKTNHFNLDGLALKVAYWAYSYLAPSRLESNGFHVWFDQVMEAKTPFGASRQPQTPRSAFNP